MFRKLTFIIVMGLASLSLLALAACSQASANSTTVKQSTIKAQISGDTVSVPLSDVDTLTNTRFIVTTASSNLSFMAYKYDNKLYVRADICPPCNSRSFTLVNDTLVCDSCGTVFKAQTGEGVRGACVKYAKQLVNYQLQDGNIVMKSTDLQNAYQNTLNPRKF
jgi:nitrite reductase/ring-hydroxylating ferredoxin subunit